MACGLCEFPASLSQGKSISAHKLNFTPVRSVLGFNDVEVFQTVSLGAHVSSCANAFTMWTMLMLGVAETYSKENYSCCEIMHVQEHFSIHY